MPTKFAYCTMPGCPNKVTYGKGRCLDCKARAVRQSGTSNARGYDYRWQRTSKLYRAAHPWCEWPDCVARSAVVDHIDGLGPRGPRGHDWTNLRALCKLHHDQRTAADQPGGWHAP